MRLRLVLAVAALGLAAVFSLAACGGDVVRVPMPSEPASPRAVMLAYLDALVAGDCETARALSTPGSLGPQGQGVWCRSPRVLAYEAPGPSDAPGGDVTHEQVYSVGLNLSGTTDGHWDGWGSWFIDLRRQPDATWRVNGIGSGP